MTDLPDNESKGLAHSAFSEGSIPTGRGAETADERPVLVDLFSGIGSFSLGLERAGYRTATFCENDPAARRILRKHWPETPCYEDVRLVTADRLATDGITSVHTLCGGFPCQDLSHAGRGAGLSGKRSGLWFDLLRVIKETRPHRVIIENVPRLRARGLDVVLGGLAALGYDAEWHCIPAAAAGAPDIRDRVWIIAYPQHSYTDGVRPHSASLDLEGSPELQHEQDGVAGPLLPALPRCGTRLGSGTYGRWDSEPRIRRVAARTPANVDRVRMLGNTLKPILAEVMGLAALGASDRSTAGGYDDGAAGGMNPTPERPQ